MRYIAQLEITEKELARIRSEIMHADTAAISRINPLQERAAATRAAAYVWLSAILERVVRESLQSTLREISAASLPLKDLRLSLFSLICEGDFESVATRNRSNAWDTKIALFAKTADATPTILSEHILPLDSRTIRAEHFDVIWLVLGLSNRSLPSPIHRIALKDLAEGRNEVAHGNIDPVSFGRAKATADILNLTKRVDDVITHLLTGLDVYLDHRFFVR